MKLLSFEDDAMANFSYLLWEESSGRAAVVDPTGDTSRILAAARAAGAHIELVLNTHGHGDHTSGNEAIVAATGARVAAHRSSPVRKDVELADGTTLELGALRLEVLHTPGHTPDGVCFLVAGKLFTGDTLFVGECGRADLPGSDPAALFESLFGQLLALPDETEVYPGHDYGPTPSSTIGAERRTNYTLAPRTLAEFVAFMAEP